MRICAKTALWVKLVASCKAYNLAQKGEIVSSRRKRPHAAFVNVYDRVTLTEDVPEHRLKRGQVGTVVEILSGDLFEVAFEAPEQPTICAVPASKLVLLDDPRSKRPLH